MRTSSSRDQSSSAQRIRFAPSLSFSPLSSLSLPLSFLAVSPLSLSPSLSLFHPLSSSLILSFQEVIHPFSGQPISGVVRVFLEVSLFFPLFSPLSFSSPSHSSSRLSYLLHLFLPFSNSLSSSPSLTIPISLSSPPPPRMGLLRLWPYRRARRPRR